MKVECSVEDCVHQLMGQCTQEVLTVKSMTYYDMNPYDRSTVQICTSFKSHPSSKA